MTNERLEDFVIIATEFDIDLNYEEIIDIFAKGSPILQKELIC